MFKLKLICLFLILIIFNSCAKDQIKNSSIKEKSLELQVLEAYQEGMKLLKEETYSMQQKNLMRLKLYFHNLIGLQNML